MNKQKIREQIEAIRVRQNAAPDLCRDIDTLINIIEQLLKEKKRK